MQKTISKQTTHETLQQIGNNSRMWSELEIHIMNVQPTSLQQLHDAVMSTFSRIFGECFRYFIKSLPWRINEVLKAEEGNEQGVL